MVKGNTEKIFKVIKNKITDLEKQKHLSSKEKMEYLIFDLFAEADGEHDDIYNATGMDFALVYYTSNDENEVEVHNLDEGCDTDLHSEWADFI
jgi:hypothetical protein